jgi:hypothetical protein
MNKKSTKKTITHQIFYFGHDGTYAWQIELPFRLNIGDNINYDLFFDRGLLIQGGKEDDELYKDLSTGFKTLRIDTIYIAYEETEIIKAFIKI